MFGLSELAVILVVVIVVLAVKKGPDLARSAGKSARILKAEKRAAAAAEGDAPPRVVQGEVIPPDGPSAPGTGG
ncbi:translocase [Streptomyces dioscori]|uniref:Translocase n=1 Tax=Streptomyces dioscori TaxID=2109333 RepID=A0A2P8Q6J2_9ACTN|nr:twin-arginine translocase TatA/TatE family subunit [Streptomyces dioscori]PSM41857.1 translocase [Streptomyces dioscori]